MRRFLIRLGIALDSVPFRLKVIGLVLGITFVLGAVSAIELRRDIYFALSEELDFRGRSISQELASRAGDDLATRDLYGLYVLLDSSVRHNQDLEYAFVTDERGQVVASTFSEGVPPALREFEPEIELPSMTEVVMTLDLDGRRIREIRAPVYGSPDSAIVRVGMSEERIETAMEQATQGLMGLTIAAGTAAILIGLLLTGLLLKPLEDIIQAMRRLAQGDLTHRVKPSVDADMAFIATSFNDMAADIERRTIEGAEDQRMLEAANRELTLLQRLSLGCSTDVDPSTYLDECVHLGVCELAALGGWAAVQDTEGGSFSSAVGLPADRVKHACMETCLFSCRLHAGSSGEIPSECPAYAFARVGKGSLSGLRLSLVEIPSREGAEGLIALIHRREDFESGTLGVLRAMAGQMGVVLENLMLHKDRVKREKRLSSLLASTLEAQEGERHRVARELHDDIGQKMTYMKLGLKVLDEGAQDPIESRRLIQGLRETVSESIDGVRRAIANLGPAPLDDLGLVPALERLLRDAASTYGFKADFQAVGGRECPLEPAVAAAAYRIVQEAINNAGRHSHCSRVSVVVRHNPGACEIVIEDDGCGFDVDAVVADRITGAHVGLDGMRERSEIVGGRLLIESTEHVGTTVHVRLPAMPANAPMMRGVAHG